jgi:hypothetical protein
MTMSAATSHDPWRSSPDGIETAQEIARFTPDDLDKPVFEQMAVWSERTGWRLDRLCPSDRLFVMSFCIARKRGNP